MANLIDTLVEQGHFTTLVTALRAAGILDELASGGPWTIFAPTDEAFENVDPKVLENLLGNIPELSKVLRYHVVSGKLTSDDIEDRDLDRLDTLAGEPLHLEGMTVNDCDVTHADIMADNGVIHQIDRVLKPPSLRVPEPAMTQ